MPLSFSGGDRYAKHRYQNLSDIEDRIPRASQRQDFKTCVIKDCSVLTFVLR